jgi:hypothetical protein
MKTFKKLTRKAFKNWLLENKDNMVAPKNYETTSCPIANFIKAETKFTNVTVPGYKSDPLRINREEYEKPKWALKFIEKIDHSNGGDKIITGKDALKVLDNI